MALAVGLGAIQAWNHRFEFASEDIVSYLDVADFYLQGAWASAINGNWSPLYSFCLALAQAVLDWGPAWDACRVKLVNFIIFLGALICFRFFLHNLLLFRERRAASGDASGAATLPAWLLTTGGYLLLFLWSTLLWTGLFCDTPDMSTAALVYLACGMLLQMQTRPDSWLRFGGLGTVLGLGYLSKAAMFPLAFVFLVAATPTREGLRRALPRVFLVLLTFTMTAGPYVAALSSAKGRLTFSEAGKLSYAWWVNPGIDIVPDHHWQGGPPEAGTPLHPTRPLFDNPALFEFADPIDGTYPPWTDPSYWYDGIRVQFAPAKVWAVTWRNLAFYWEFFLATLLGGFLLLACAGGRPGRSVLALAETWRILIPAIAGLGMYLVSTDFAANTMQNQPSTRFIAPFVVVLFATSFAAVRYKPSLPVRRLVVGLACVGLLLASGKPGWQMARETKVLLQEKRENTHWRSAQAVRRLGIRAGDRVAVIGGEYDHVFWARLARVKIIAQVPDSKAFWAKDAAVRFMILRPVEDTGASAVVWKKAKSAGYGAYLFHGTSGLGR
jgi:hypothetical protein